MSLLQLNPMIPVWVPSRAQAGLACVLLDDGPEHDAFWTVIMQDGEIWTFPQSHVRGQENVTVGRGKTCA